MSGDDDMNQAVLILGMHRSGTSAVAYGVQALGYTLGSDMMPGHEDNPKGYGEDKLVVAHNDALLQALAASWDMPHLIDEGSLAGLDESTEAERVGRLVARCYGAGRRIAIKDPRLSLLLPVWQAALSGHGYAAKRILCLRHPGEVARSLGKRDQLTEMQSLHLWFEYNVRVLRDTTAEILVVSYGRLLSDPRAAMTRVMAFLEAPGDAQTAGALATFCRDFVDPDLNRSALPGAGAPVPSFPAYVQTFYEALHEASEADFLTEQEAHLLAQRTLAHDPQCRLEAELSIVRAALRARNRRLNMALGDPKDFDEANYFRLNPDVAADGMRGHEHFIKHGYFEGREV